MHGSSPDRFMNAGPLHRQQKREYRLSPAHFLTRSPAEKKTCGGFIPLRVFLDQCHQKRCFFLAVSTL